MLAMSMMLGGLPVYDITLSSNRGRWQKSVDGTQVPSNIPVSLILRISSAIEITSNTTALAAIVIDELASGSQFYLINAGYAMGRGGNGGAASGFFGAAGSNGGDAIRLDFTGVAQITNTSGRIWSGGGGGGGGGPCWLWNSGAGEYLEHQGGGGGGGGAGGAAAGAGGSGASAGTAGTTGSVGTNGTGGADGDPNNAGDGGAGGAYGAAGSAGGTGIKHGSGPSNGSLSNGGAAGNAGYAIRHNAGTTVSFVSGSSSPNVKGTVGS